MELWQLSGSDGPVPAILATAGLVAGVGLLIWVRLARCAETGDRIYFCHCPVHSGE